MIRYYLYIILLISSLSILSQTNKSTFDSIIKLAIDGSDDITVQIDTLNSQAAFYIKIKPPLAIDLAQHALDLAIGEEYLYGQAVAHYTIGTCLVYEKFDVALKHLIESGNLASQLGDNSLQASSLLSISTVYHGMHQYDKAINTAKKAHEIANGIDNLNLLSRVHTNLASYYYTKNEIAKALSHSQMAIDLKIELNDSYGLRLNYLNLGIILLESDSTLDKGVSYLIKSRTLSSDDPIMVNDIMANMIWAYSRKQDYGRCLSYLDSALLGNDTIDNKFTRQGIHRLGKEIHFELGDYEMAYNHAVQEFEIDKELRGKEVEGQFKILELENENYEKQKQILILEKKRSEANLKFLYAIVLAALFLLLFGVVYKSYRLKKGLLDNLKVQQLEIEEKSHLLEIKNKEVEQFVYVASHDLKAPLNTIISCINLLTEEIGKKLDTQSQQMASFINSSASRMKSMIDSLLEHGRLGKDIVFEEVDLNNLILDLRQDLHQLIKETNTKLEVNYLPKVKGSATELLLLFQNLITNAIKFSSIDQTPLLSISYKSLKKAKRHQFSIRDNGVGIPENRRDIVFKLFERAHGKEFDGSGIGLAHCQKIVKLHKGSIWFDSIEGKGTTFHFVLPMKDWTNSDSLKK
ncbi:ATP-binding protein [Ekhidna sp.]|uniref:ATP-binding protein n=1 Tax=Ekhidna sp. TaxID=2608089 RepID=UPI00329A4DFA